MCIIKEKPIPFSRFKMFFFCVELLIKCGPKSGFSVKYLNSESEKLVHVKRAIKQPEFPCNINRVEITLIWFFLLCEYMMECFSGMR